jgi:hypothetical protein
MHLIHGSLWNNDLRLMMDPVPADEARAVYERGGEIMVAAGRVPLQGVAADSAEPDPEDPEPAAWSLYAELDRGFVEVEFFNLFGTREATYSFRRQPDGRLFLAEVAEYDFDQRTADTGDWDWSSVEEHLFEPDGTSSLTRRRKLPDGSTDVTTEDFKGGDFAAHWEPVPAFGEWDSITRRQR